MNNAHKFPTIIGLLLLVGLVGIIIFMAEKFVRMSQAAVIPKKIQFTNISDTSFTVSWITEAETTGAVSFFSGNNSAQSAFDERDDTIRMGQYRAHSIVVRGLSPNTLYFVKLKSKTYTFDDHGSPFYVTTGPQLTTESTKLEPSYGTIMTANDQPAGGAIVYLELEGSQLLSTLVSKSGTWIIPLNLIRTKDTKNYLNPSTPAKETIHVIDAAGEGAAVTDTANDAPVPVINIGKSYDFRKRAKIRNLALGETPSVLGESDVSGEVTLSQPRDGALLTTSLPLFTGTGVPGNPVSMVWGITHPAGASVKVDQDGTWRFTPPVRLGEGKQSVTITSNNIQNVPIAITHSFLIFKSGTQVLGDATPSATLFPTTTLSPTPIATTTPIPVTATTAPTISLLIFGLILLGGGMFLIIP